jgi:hypothetical protein
MIVWVVVDEDHPTTPIGGVWTTMVEAAAHCPDGYAILKVILDTDMCRPSVF